MILAVFLFNVTGYYWLQNILIKHEEEKFSYRLDNKLYQEKDLVEIKVPLSMPYYQNTDYVRVDGRINIKGFEYSYVKRKIENGFLVLKCIPNIDVQRIEEKTANYFSHANGFEKPSSQKDGQSKSAAKISIDDFEDMNLFATMKLKMSIKTKYSSFESCFLPLYHSNPQEQPPDYIA